MFESVSSIGWRVLECKMLEKYYCWLSDRGHLKMSEKVPTCLTFSSGKCYKISVGTIYTSCCEICLKWTLWNLFSFQLLVVWNPAFQYNFSLGIFLYLSYLIIPSALNVNLHGWLHLNFSYCVAFRLISYPEIEEVKNHIVCWSVTLWPQGIRNIFCPWINKPFWGKGFYTMLMGGIAGRLKYNFKKYHK